MPKIAINQQVTFLYTADLAETARFYETVFEFPLILDQGACRIYQVCDTAFIGFCQRATPPENTDNIIFTLVTPAVDDWYAHLLSQNVPVQKPPAHNPDFNIYHCFVRDPNDYLIEIQQFLDPTWPESQ